MLGDRQWDRQAKNDIIEHVIRQSLLYYSMALPTVELTVEGKVKHDGYSGMCKIFPDPK
jgi:hypothetical protein